MDIVAIHNHVKLVTLLYPQNSVRKNYFLATCKFLDNSVALEFIDERVPFGGTIGINNSRLEYIFGNLKFVRLHAILHDAAGYMKAEFNSGPGYCYLLPGLPNNCFLGHVTGLSYCLALKLFSSFYRNLDC